MASSDKAVSVVVRVTGFTFPHVALSHVALSHVAFAHVSLGFSSHVFVAVLHCCMVLGLGLGLLFSETLSHASVARVAHEMVRWLFGGRALAV